jgi:hypothetical protein
MKRAGGCGSNDRALSSNPRTSKPKQNDGIYKEPKKLNTKKEQIIPQSVNG